MTTIICADLYFFRGWGGGGLTEYFNSRGGGGVVKLLFNFKKFEFTHHASRSVHREEHLYRPLRQKSDILHICLRTIV